MLILLFGSKLFEQFMTPKCLIHGWEIVWQLLMVRACRKPFSEELLLQITEKEKPGTLSEWFLSLVTPSFISRLDSQLFKVSECGKPLSILILFLDITGLK
jgi:hypothetical protein